MNAVEFSKLGWNRQWDETAGRGFRQGVRTTGWLKRDRLLSPSLGLACAEMGEE